MRYHPPYHLKNACCGRKIDEKTYVPASAKNPKTDEQKPKAQPVATQSKLSYEEQKEQERRQRKAKKAVEDSEALIVEYEAAIAEMDNQLANHPYALLP